MKGDAFTMISGRCTLSARQGAAAEARQIEG
jgi:hypothetical protein